MLKFLDELINFIFREMLHYINIENEIKFSLRLVRKFWNSRIVSRNFGSKNFNLLVELALTATIIKHFKGLE